MIAIFQCVAEAVAFRGFRSLVAELPFGNFLVEVASDAWNRLRRRKLAAGMRAEIEKAAQAAADEVKRAAASAARQAIPNDPERAAELERYLTQIPAAVRQSLRRPADPTGRTAPAAFGLNRPEDLLPLLPPRVSRFRPGDALPGRDGWQLLELLGTGGFGEVWLARHPQFASLRRAVKFCTDLTDRDRVLLHEGGMIDRVMQAGPVPHTVSLIDADLLGPTPWLMYEYVPGGDLASHAAEWCKLPAPDRFSRAVGAVRQIATAVAHFHRLGVVHRDLKPANVLVGAAAAAPGSVEYKVADFGIGGAAARRELEAGKQETATGTRLATVGRGAYTPTYAPPQQKKGFDPDPRDDIYALGVIAYQLLVGDVTAERPGGKRWRQALRNQGVPPAALDLLEACWDDEPAERPRDASDLLNRLAKAFAPRQNENLPFAEEVPVKARPVAPVRQAPPAPRPSQEHVRPTEKQPRGTGRLKFLFLVLLGLCGLAAYSQRDRIREGRYDEIIREIRSGAEEFSSNGKAGSAMPGQRKQPTRPIEKSDEKKLCEPPRWSEENVKGEWKTEPEWNEKVEKELQEKLDRDGPEQRIEWSDEKKEPVKK